MDKKKRTIYNREGTINFAKEYAKSLKAGDIVLLYGDLGAGKTTFTQGLAEGLGINEQVTSPTYAYMQNYADRLYHFDCYRLESGAQAELLGLTEYFDCGGICVIEWAENLREVLPQNCKSIYIHKIDENTREIEER